jgi:hypothetical protein
MSDKYDENRIDAVKLRFLPKSVKSCILEKKEYYVDTACTPHVHAALGHLSVMQKYGQPYRGILKLKAVK